MEIPTLYNNGSPSLLEYPSAVNTDTSNLYSPPSLNFGPFTWIFLLSSPSSEPKKSPPGSSSSTTMPESCDTKLNTRNPLSASNSSSNRNVSPRSALMWKVTSRRVTLESKSKNEIEICWSGPSSSWEELASRVTCLPFSSVGGNVSLPTPWPSASGGRTLSKNISGIIIIKYLNSFLGPLFRIFLPNLFSIYSDVVLLLKHGMPLSV